MYSAGATPSGCLVGIFLTVFAVLGGLIGGWLDDLFGSKKAIVFTIGGNIVALFAAISITPTSMFFIDMPGLDQPVWDFPFFRTIPELTYLCISVLFALFITSAYANSRTMLARIAPEEEMTKFFGLYALSGQVTTFIAPILVATVTGPVSQPARRLRVDPGAARRRPGDHGVRQGRALCLDQRAQT